jgi:hypothetical protein
MNQHNVGAPFERITVDLSRKAREGTDTKWPEVYAFPNQEASRVAVALLTNFFCRFGVPRELHINQGRNFES